MISYLFLDVCYCSKTFFLTVCHIDVHDYRSESWYTAGEGVLHGEVVFSMSVGVCFSSRRRTALSNLQCSNRPAIMELQKPYVEFNICCCSHIHKVRIFCLRQYTSVYWHSTTVITSFSMTIPSTTIRHQYIYHLILFVGIICREAIKITLFVREKHTDQCHDFWEVFQHRLAQITSSNCTSLSFYCRSPGRRSLGKLHTALFLISQARKVISSRRISSAVHSAQFLFCIEDQCVFILAAR